MQNNQSTPPQNNAEAAARIITLVREHLPESQDYSQMEALWMAFLGLHGPRAAAAELRNYLPMLLSK